MARLWIATVRPCSWCPRILDWTSAAPDASAAGIPAWSDTAAGAVPFCATDDGALQVDAVSQSAGMPISSLWTVSLNVLVEMTWPMRTDVRAGWKESTRLAVFKVRGGLSLVAGVDEVKSPRQMLPALVSRYRN